MAKDTAYEMLEKVVETLSEKIQALEAKEAGASTVVEAAAPNYPIVPKETFEFKKKTYKFKVSGVFHDNQKVLAVDALADEKLLALFVETYPNTVEKINL